MKDVSEWLEKYRQHWEERLDRLDAYLTKIQLQKYPDTDPDQKDISL
jgi:hypothetical protein